MISVMCILISVAAADGAAQKVSVVGGADPTGHQYVWTVTNHYTSPIVRIEFAHFRGGLFLAPDGWSTDETTNLVNVGVQDQTGICVAQARNPDNGVAPGESIELSLRVPGRARRGSGQFRVRFADGTTVMVAGVELPQAPSASDTYVSLIGLAVIFGSWLAFQAVRRRRRAQRSS